MERQFWYDIFDTMYTSGVSPGFKKFRKVLFHLSLEPEIFRTLKSEFIIDGKCFFCHAFRKSLLANHGARRFQYADERRKGFEPTELYFT